MMGDDLRQNSGSTITGNTTTVPGPGAEPEMVCGCPQPEEAPETIQVEQVLGANMQQKVVEFDMTVPDAKPDIEQVIDVYVKDVAITAVNVITNKVVVRGELSVKVMYVADKPNQPVHAFEQPHVRFTRDIPIEGATKDMTANADVSVEFIDYDFNPDTDKRTVHITIVLKFWSRVMTTTEMDVSALMAPQQPMGGMEAPPMPPMPQGAGENQVVPQNVTVTGPGVSPTAGTSMGPSGSATITGTSVNVRTGPGTNFPVVTKVNNGDVVTIKDQAFGWYKVVLSDGSTTGWVASWLVSTGTPAAPNG